MALKSDKKDEAGVKSMEMDETTHILDHEHFPDTPESSKSDIHQLTQDDSSSDKHRSSLPMASFNFINSIIGSGIIGMPLALQQAGFGMGILLMLLVTLVTDYSLVLLIHGGELSNRNTYQDVMQAAFGRTGFVILTIMQFLYPFISMLSYNIIIGDTITKIVARLGGVHVANTVLVKRQFIIAAVTLVVTLPISLYRDIAKLGRVSLIAIACIIFVIGVMIGKAFTMNVPPSEDAWQFANTGILSATGIMAFAYMCHHNSFLIYDSLIEPTAKRWSVVTHASMLFSMACTLILGITGYATFTGYSQGDVLENYCQSDDIVNVARFVFAFTVMLTYPIECFVTREVVENAVFAFKRPIPLWRHVIITTTIVGLTVGFSMATDCVSIVLELNGIMNAAPMAYIFPALCVMQLQNERILSWKNVPCMLTALFGIVIFVVGLVLAAIEIANGVKCSHGKDMWYCAAADSTNVTSPITSTPSPLSKWLPSATTSSTV